MHCLIAYQVDPNDPNGPELDVRLDELRATIRRSEISKAKYESRLECLRVSGAPVDDWLKEVDLLAVQEPLQRSSSLLSVRTDVSGAAVSISTFSIEALSKCCLPTVKCLYVPTEIFY